jgi:hypothetical protein
MVGRLPTIHMTVVEKLTTKGPLLRRGPKEVAGVVKLLYKFLLMCELFLGNTAVVLRYGR